MALAHDRPQSNDLPNPPKGTIYKIQLKCILCDIFLVHLLLGMEGGAAVGVRRAQGKQDCFYFITEGKECLKVCW